MRRKCRERFPCHQRKSQVRDHARAVMHIGIANEQWWEYVPGIPGACATRNFTYLARRPCSGLTRYIHVFSTSFHISCLIKHHTNTLTQSIHYQSVYGHENTQCWGHRLISNIVHTRNQQNMAKGYLCYKYNKHKSYTLKYENRYYILIWPVWFCMFLVNFVHHRNFRSMVR